MSHFLVKHSPDEMAVLAGAAIEIPKGALPPTIMWAPPGTHKITASQGGKPATMEITIDAETAATVEADRQRYNANAAAGQGGEVYIDSNHNDEEASAQVQEFFWGGDDPKIGGVRAKVAWTSAGEAAVRGRTYRRFSPSFFAKNGRITGIPQNCGGLVNRPAFLAVQPIDLIAAKAISEAIRGIHTSNDFLAAAHAKAGQLGIDLDVAYETLAKESPEGYEIYCKSLGLGGNAAKNPAKRSPLLYATTAPGIMAVALAEVIAAKAGTDAADEVAAIAASRPAFYSSYRASLDLGSLSFQQEQREQSEESEFLKKIAEVVEQHGISENAAFALVAEKFPELFEQYRRDIAGLDPAEVRKQL